MKDNMKLGDYMASATCIGCDRDGKECMVLITEAFAGPHCAKCLFREGKKRSKKADDKPHPYAETA